MVRIPALLRRSETNPVRDENSDGRVDGRDAAIAEQRSADGPPGAGTAPAVRRDADGEPMTPTDPMTRTDTGRTAAEDLRPEGERGPRVVTRPAGPRPRASALATLGLVAGVSAAFLALSGSLAGYGVGVGALALLLSIGGVSASGRRHVAGKPDALIGLALGLGAVVVGVLALTGQFGWPTMDGDPAERARQWLDSQIVDRF